MAEVNVTINGRVYGIACDDGQEQRLLELGRYVDERIKEISRAGAATNESHLLVLTSILMADEIFDLKDGKAANTNSGISASGLEVTKADEGAIVQALDSLASRIDTIADDLIKTA